MLCVRSDYNNFTTNCCNQASSGRRPSATSCRSRACLESDTLIKLTAMRFVRYFEEGTLHVPKLFPFSLPTIKTYPICHIHTSGYDGEFSCAYYYHPLLTMPSHMHAIHRGHLSSPLGSYCRGSYGTPDCLKARQPRGQIIKFMWRG